MADKGLQHPAPAYLLRFILCYSYLAHFCPFKSTFFLTLPNAKFSHLKRHSALLSRNPFTHFSQG